MRKDIFTTNISTTNTFKVAAYIRVSTQNEMQESSFEQQEQYFIRTISANKNWEFAGIYSDYGISGTSNKNRGGLKRILRHCKEGRINRILCKSVSRFARNTSDLLESVRILKESGTTICFEKENLDTAKFTSEFILTTLAAIAQEESRSISENLNWAVRKRYSMGIAPNKEIYGYRFIEKEELTIVEEEAEIVRLAFKLAYEGKTFRYIARELNRMGIAAPKDKWARLEHIKNQKAEPPNFESPKGFMHTNMNRGWTGARVGYLLQNERYCSDVLLQKKFTEDYLAHHISRNHGERKKYLITNHHPPIISRELFYEVQGILKKNKERYNRDTKIPKYPYSGKLICAHCDRFYISRNRKNYPRWFCPSAALNNGKDICHAKVIYEDQIISVIQNAMIERFSLSQSLNFIKDIKAHLIHTQNSDFVEQDRSFLKYMEQDTSEEVRDTLNYIENYWLEQEEDLEWRMVALKWLDQMEGCTVEEFLEGLESGMIRAFVISILIIDSYTYKIRWFDDSVTAVHMETNIKEWRETRQFRTGKKMYSLP